MQKTIMCSNQKGGTGKSVTAVNLSFGLAAEGYRVLLIDADAQGSATISMGCPMQDDLEVSLATVLEKILNNEPLDFKEGILHHEEGVDFLPGNIETSFLEKRYSRMLGWDRVLQAYVEEVKEFYDYIIIDCSPSLEGLTSCAFVCADEIIIPVCPAYLPVKGLEQLLKTISSARRLVNPKLKIRGILLTMVDWRTNYAKEIIDLLQKTYGARIPIFQTCIPRSVRAAEAPASGMSIYRYDPKGKVAESYRLLTKEVLTDGSL